MARVAGTPRQRKASGSAESLELVDVDYLSAWFKKPRKTIYRHAKEGRLPGVVRLGRSLRFDRAKIEAWLAAGGQGYK
jgi:excisionase family DNA binding protein